MKFTVRRKDAQRLRQILSSFRWEQEYDVASLSSEAQDRLVVVGGNDKQGFRVEIPARVERPGSGHYAATRLGKALSAAVLGDMVSFSASEKTGRLTIKSGTVTTRMASRTGLVVSGPAEEKPDLILAQKPFSAAVAFTEFAAADRPDAGKDFLSGISLRQYKGKDALAVECTDGTKYAMALAPAKFQTDGWEAIIPRTAVRLLKLVKARDGLLSLGLSGGKFWLKGDLTVWSTMYTDKFPDVMGMVSAPEKPLFAVETVGFVSDILAALDGVDTEKNVVRVSGFRGRTLLLASEGETLSISATAQAAVYEDVDVSLNAGYLGTALQKLSAPVYFYQAAPNAPVFLKEKGADRLIMLLPFAVRDKPKKAETDF